MKQNDFYIKLKLKNIFIFLSALNILLLAMIIFLIYNNTQNNRYFNKYIVETDNYLKNRDFINIEKSIIKAEEKVNSEEKALILLKRAYKYNYYISDYKLLLRISSEIYKKYKYNEKIYSIYLFSLLKNKEHEQLFENITLKKININTVREIFLEGYSYCLIKKSDIQISDKIKKKLLEDDVFFKIISDNNEFNNYKESFALTGNNDFMYNLALLYMKNNQKEKALDIAEKINNYDLLTALIYLDNKEYNKSLSVFKKINNKNEEIMLLQADLEMYSGNYDNAKIIYKTIINENKLTDYVPYMNTFFIDYIKNREINTDILEILFKNADIKNIDIINFILAVNRKEEDLTKMTEFTDNIYIKELLENRYINKDRYFASLWEIYNKGEMSVELYRFFLLELYRSGYINDMNILIEKSENNNYFNIFFSSLYDIINKNYESAENKLDEYSVYNNEWEILYNYSLLEMIKNNYNNALNILNKIIILLEKRNDTEKTVLSDLYFKKGYCLYKLKNYNTSIKYFNKSLSLDRGNIESQVFINYNKSKIVEP